MLPSDSLFRVTLTAPARLHLGFVDLNGELGRRFGSIGLALEGLSAVVDAEPSTALQVAGLEETRVARIVDQVLDHLGATTPLAVRVRELPPAHAGLGSGTLLALAVGTAVIAALGRTLEARELAQVLGRGERSGIGLAAFEGGGFLCDGGRSANGGPPPLLSRLSWPAAWRCVLILDDSRSGLSGHGELAAFARLPEMTAALAGELARQVLVGVLPALAEADFRAFSRHLGRVQQLVGDHFAPAQGGRYTRAEIGQLLESLAARFDLPGIGQSSWGPTGFIFTPDAATTEAVVAACSSRLAEGLRVRVVTGAASGARLQRTVWRAGAEPMHQSSHEEPRR